MSNHWIASSSGELVAGEACHAKRRLLAHAIRSSSIQMKIPRSLISPISCSSSHVMTSRSYSPVTCCQGVGQIVWFNGVCGENDDRGTRSSSSFSHAREPGIVPTVGKSWLRVTKEQGERLFHDPARCSTIQYGSMFKQLQRYGHLLDQIFSNPHAARDFFPPVLCVGRYEFPRGRDHTQF